MISILRQRLGFYVFGKHPAWPDFVDVSKVPSVPAPFRILHTRFRKQLEVVYRDQSAVMRFICWRNRLASVVTLVCPSHDRGNPELGFRRSPLFLGLSGFCSLQTLGEFAVPELLRTAERLFGKPLTDSEFVDEIRNYSETLPTNFQTFLAAETDEQEAEPDEIDLLNNEPAEVEDRSRIKLVGSNGTLTEWTIRCVRTLTRGVFLDSGVLVTAASPHASWLIQKSIRRIEPDELADSCKTVG